MHQIENRASKGINGWSFKTRFDMGDKRELHLTTTKLDNGQISSRASVHHVNGACLRHSLGFGSISGDFNKAYISQRPPRATEKVMRAQHEALLVKVDTIVADANQHYALQAAAKAAEATAAH